MNIRLHRCYLCLIIVLTALLGACTTTPPLHVADTSTPDYKDGIAHLVNLRPGKQIYYHSKTAKFTDIYERIRFGFAMDDIEDPLVTHYENYYAKNKVFLQRVFQRASKYLHYIIESIEARGMPTELALLPIVESAYNPRARSHAKAVGLWQFIPSTGRIYDLDQNWWVDERRDVVESTQAALNYFEFLYDKFDNWALALASYNWGEGSVGRAIAKNHKKNLPGDYQSLKMPNETRHYVPRLQALKNLFLSSETLSELNLPKIPNKRYFITYSTDSRMDISVAAELADLSIKEFMELNPAYKRPVLPSDSALALLLPADKIGLFQENLENRDSGTLSYWRFHKVKRGETLTAVAKRYGLSKRTLAHINGIRSNKKLRRNSRLLVPSAKHAIDDALAIVGKPSIKKRKKRAKRKKSKRRKYRSRSKKSKKKR